MRYLILSIIVCSVCADTFSQWQNLYPLEGDPRSIAVAGPGYIYLVNYEGSKYSLLKSSNTGRTWKKSDVGDAEAISGVFFYDSLTGYVTSYQGIYSTTDGAKTWTRRNLPAGFPAPVNIVFTSKSTGYISTANNSMAKSTDGGNTWQTLPNAPAGNTTYGNSISFSDDNNGYAVSNYRLYKTSSGGNQWAPISFNYIIESVYAVSSDVAYITASSSIYKTMNGGATWEMVRNQGAKAMYFKNASEGFFFESYGRITKTMDGGQTANPVYTSDYPISWAQISFSAQMGCAIGGDRAILTTTDGGNSWKLNQLRPQHGEFRDVHFTSANEGFIIRDSGGIVRTDDNGSSWYYDENHFDRDDLYQVAFSSADTGIFVVTSNYAYTSYDGGQTMFMNSWQVPIVGHLQSSDYEMVSSKVIYTVGQKVKVAKSVDGGKSWTSFNFDFENGLKTIECLDANTCHAAGTVGKVVSTWDGGAHWTVHELEVNNDLNQITFINRDVGFIGGSRGTIPKTVNGGVSWNVHDTEAGGAVLSFHFLTPQKGYAVTTGGEVLRTDNGGETWSLKQGAGGLGLYSSLVKTFMRDTASIFGISERSILRWTPPAPKPPVMSAIGSPEVAGQRTSVAIYPNPASERLYLRSPETISEVKIIDIRGNVVRRSTATDEIDISDLPAGMYIIQAALHSAIEAHRIIKRP